MRTATTTRIPHIVDLEGDEEKVGEHQPSEHGATYNATADTRMKPISSLLSDGGIALLGACMRTNSSGGGRKRNKMGGVEREACLQRGGGC